MLALFGAAALAGPNGTAPAAENRGIETNPPSLPRGIELTLSRATGPTEYTPLECTMRIRRCGACPAQRPHARTAPQAGGSSLVCTPRRGKLLGGNIHCDLECMHTGRTFFELIQFRMIIIRSNIYSFRAVTNPSATACHARTDFCAHHSHSIYSRL